MTNKTNDSNPATSISAVERIKHHHGEALNCATQAVAHAKQAGELLLKAKTTIPHGGWLSWLSENCAVSPRQAQRYMEAAQGKNVAISTLAKSDTMTYLPEQVDSRSLSEFLPKPTFLPKPGHWMTTATDDAAFHVVPSLEHPDHFHISKFYSVPATGFDPELHVGEGDPTSMFDGTRRPVVGYAVECSLRCFGLAEPSKADWQVIKHPGMSRPFGEPEPPHIQEMG